MWGLVFAALLAAIGSVVFSLAFKLLWPALGIIVMLTALYVTWW